jgi:hypothetical protein
MNITRNDFRGLNTCKKLDVLFDNIEDVKKLITGYKFYQKVSALIGTVLVAGMAMIFKMQFVQAYG